MHAVSMNGAACLVLMSEKKVKETGVKPLAKIVDVTAAALDPEIMGYGPVVSTKKILERITGVLQMYLLVQMEPVTLPPVKLQAKPVFTYT